MGIDISFKARPFVEVTDEQFASLRARLHETYPDPDADEKCRFPDLFWDECEPVPTLEVRHWWRYYGPDYARGYWPDIKRLGDWLAVELGELAELRYGDDHVDDFDAFTPWGKVRDVLQRHWDEAA